MIEIFHTENPQLAYDDLYSKKGIRLRDSFYLWILSILKPNSPGKFLDISCGEGQLVHLAHSNDLYCVGIDFSIAAIKRQNPKPLMQDGSSQMQKNCLSLLIYSCMSLTSAA